MTEKSAPVGVVKMDDRGRINIKKHLVGEAPLSWVVYRSADGQHLTLEAVTQ